MAAAIAPSAPGRYRLRADLVRHGLWWFENLGVAPVEWQLDVAGGGAGVDHGQSRGHRIGRADEKLFDDLSDSPLPLIMAVRKAPEAQPGQIPQFSGHLKMGQHPFDAIGFLTDILQKQ